jgi:hypothetical protein
MAAATTGVMMFGAVAATGVVTGLVARKTAEQNASEQQESSAVAGTADQRQDARPGAQRPAGQIRLRPQRTVLHTRIVRWVSAPGVVQPGPGADVTNSRPPVTSDAPAPAPAPSRTTAPPAPAPAPSSGS